MLGLSFAAVPLYDLFCRVTGFGGTTQISNEAPKIVLDETINVRLDTNVNSQLDWKFESESNTMEVKPGKVYKIKFNVENLGSEPSSGVAATNSEGVNNGYSEPNLSETHCNGGRLLNRHVTHTASN